MKVFISYSRQDAPFVYALKYILESRKIRCFVDRAMPSGSQFPDEIKTMIREADVVIVVLTEASQDSTWVNHECGFALAEKKKIWPVALSKNVQPWGMLSNLHSHSMFDWGDPKRVFDDFIKALKSSHLNDEDHFRAVGMDRVISGQVERTEFVVAQLRRLVKAGNRKLRVYNQAIFSSFAVIDDPEYWNGESIECKKSYRKLLLEERSLLEKLVRMPSVSFTLSLCPLPFGYADNTIRYQGLLQWMRDNVDQPGVRLCCSKFAGQNRLMVMDDFAIESSFDPNSGYSRNIVSYDKVKILKAAEEVEAFCKGAFTAKDAVDEIQRRFDSYKQAKT